MLWYGSLMPIKISPAFLLHRDADLHALSHALRETITPILVTAFQKEFVNMVVADYDYPSPEGAQFSFAAYLRRKGSEVFQAVFGNQEDYDEITMSDLADIRDFRAVFVKNTVRDETYLLFTHHIPHTNLQEAVLALNGVASDYSYWNSGLRPETLSEKEWADRGEAWSQTLDYNEDLPSQGLLVRFLDRFAKRDAIEIDDADTLKSLLRPNYEEERFRRMVVEHYIRESKDIGIKDKMEFLSRELPLFVYGAERDYSKIPGTSESQELLKQSIQAAEARLMAFRIGL